MWRRENKIISNLKQCLRGLAQLDREKSNASVNLIINDELWRQSKPRKGESFLSLPHWVSSPEPEGLGVSDQKTAKLLRMLLLEAGRLDAWAIILVHVSTGPGRPKKLVGDEDFRPFYRVPTASNAIDRRLHRLFNREPDVFELVASGAISLPQAEKRVGWPNRASRAVTRTIEPVCLDKLTEAYKLLNEQGQAEMLGVLWEHTAPTVRSTFVKHNPADI